MDVVTVARVLAEEVLFPNSLAVDTADLLPVSGLDAFAAAGLYGLAVPTALGGLGADAATVNAVAEHLASGCLTTTFVFMQHHNAARATAAVPTHHARARRLASGEERAGVAFAHLRRPGPPAVTATPVAGGWQIHGDAPWITGWGRIDVVLVAARHRDDVVWSIVDAVESATLSVRPLRLAALDASGTARLLLRGHLVSADRVTHVEPLAEWRARDALTLRTNGSLALGVTRRAAALLGPSALDGELDAARQALDAADAEAMPAARGQATALAVRAASALLADGGGRAIARDHHAQRLAREALFLVVQGQTAAIRAEQLRWLHRRS